MRDRPEIDFERAKSTHPLKLLIEGWGVTFKKSGREWVALCPFHDEKTPSFYVNEEKGVWICRGSCACGGDVFDAVQMRENGTIDKSPIARRGIDGKVTIDRTHPLVRAYFIVSGQAEVVPADRPAPSPENKNKKAISIDEVKRWAANGYMAYDSYLQSRAITLDAVSKYHIGYRRWNCYGRAAEAMRVTIPYFVGNQVMAVQQRLDVNDARLRMKSMGKDFTDKVRIDIANRTSQEPDEILESHMIDEIFGKKYFKDARSKGSIYNLNHLLSLTEDGEMIPGSRPGHPMLQDWSYVLIVEGEIDALTLLSAGFPAVSILYKSGVDYDFWLSCCRFKYIISDNDSAGKEKSKKIFQSLSPRSQKMTSIVDVPDPFKDINEMAIHGKLEQWLSHNKFFVFEERKIRENVFVLS